MEYMVIHVAIPKLNKGITPCFEAASGFVVAAVENKKVISQKVVNCPGTEGHRRIRLIKVHDIEILICNGIKGFYRDLLYTMGVKVISDVNVDIEKALADFAAGLIKPVDYAPEIPSEMKVVPLEELISWSQELFESNGYRVMPGPGQDSFLIDLVAELHCPVCGKTIKVAICCGAHTYRTEQELKEFHFFAKGEYNARVFIYPQSDKIGLACEEYGIDYIPFRPEESSEDTGGCKIPLLRNPITGHDKIVPGRVE